MYEFELHLSATLRHSVFAVKQINRKDAMTRGVAKKKGLMFIQSAIKTEFAGAGEE